MCSDPEISVLRDIGQLAVAQYIGIMEGRRVVFNDALNTFSYGYMASDIW